MKVSEVMKKNVVCVNEEDFVSKVLTKMEAGSMHQLIVTRGEKDGKFVGMIVLKDLLIAECDPQKTKIKKFVVCPATLDVGDNLEDAVVKILNSGYKALPVLKEGELDGIVSMTDLIKYVDYSEEVEVEKFLGVPIIMKDTDNLGKALSLMADHNISRLPVVNYEDKLVGVFDALSLIKFLKFPCEPPRVSSLFAVEKESLKDFLVKDYLRPTVAMNTEEFSVKKAVGSLQSHEEILLTRKDVPVGVITAKDLLELAVQEEEMPIYISHYKKIDPMLYERFEDLLYVFVKKFSKQFSIQKFFIYVDAYEAGLGDKKFAKKFDDKKYNEKFSLRARLITAHKFFAAHSFAWDLVDATHILLEKLEKQLVKYHEKDMDLKKQKKTKKQRK
jgi:CBS domain-containing protein